MISLTLQIGQDFKLSIKVPTALAALLLTVLT